MAMNKSIFVLLTALAACTTSVEPSEGLEASAAALTNSGATPWRDNATTELFRLLGRSASWTLVEQVAMDFPTYHTQGLVKIGETFYASAVEVLESTARNGTQTDALFDFSTELETLEQMGPQDQVLVDGRTDGSRTEPRCFSISRNASRRCSSAPAALASCRLMRACQRSWHIRQREQRESQELLFAIDLERGLDGLVSRQTPTSGVPIPSTPGLSSRIASR
jgi:hypothetical protein